MAPLCSEDQGRVSIAIDHVLWHTVVQQDPSHGLMAAARRQSQSGVAEAVAHQGVSSRVQEKRDRLVVARGCSDEQERSAVLIACIR